MAQFIAEGMRMGGCEVDLVSISKVNSDAEIIGYDGYVFGCPTYHKDMTNNMKQFIVKTTIQCVTIIDKISCIS